MYLSREPFPLQISKPFRKSIEPLGFSLVEPDLISGAVTLPTKIKTRAGCRTGKGVDMKSGLLRELNATHDRAHA